MNKHKYTPKALLMKRVEHDYEDFKASMVRLDGESLFELAPSIAVVHDVYSLIKHTDCIYDEYAAYLLNKKNPLYFLADEWQEYLENASEDNFDDMLIELMDDIDDGEEYRPTLADELREKYGGDISLDTAALLEIIQLGRQCLNCRDTDDYDFDTEFDFDYDEEDNI